MILYRGRDGKWSILDQQAGPIAKRQPAPMLDIQAGAGDMSRKLDILGGPGCDGGRKGQQGRQGRRAELGLAWLDALSVGFGSERRVGTTLRRGLRTVFYGFARCFTMAADSPPGCRLGQLPHANEVFGEPHPCHQSGDDFQGKKNIAR